MATTIGTISFDRNGEHGYMVGHYSYEFNRWMRESVKIIGQTDYDSFVQGLRDRAQKIPLDLFDSDYTIPMILTVGSIAITHRGTGVSKEEIIESGDIITLIKSFGSDYLRAILIEQVEGVINKIERILYDNNFRPCSDVDISSIPPFRRNDGTRCELDLENEVFDYFLHYYKGLTFIEIDVWGLYITP